MTRSVLTIGYEGRSPEALMTELRNREVQVLLDVRLRPNSRKPGFSKTSLREACEAGGIQYVHDKRLGTPPEMMDHVKSGAGYDWETSEQYRVFLRTQTEALEKAVDIVTHNVTCLLCFERQPADCHRRIVAEELSVRAGVRVDHVE